MDSSSESGCALTDGSASEYLLPAESIASVFPIPITSAFDVSSFLELVNTSKCGCREGVTS